MLKTVPPHDIIGMCAECGMTLSDLAAGTGLSEDTLLRFSRGETPLSAETRLGIICLMDDWAQSIPGMSRTHCGVRSVEDAKRSRRAVTALFALIQECEDEVAFRENKHVDTVFEAVEGRTPE